MSDPNEKQGLESTAAAEFAAAFNAEAGRGRLSFLALLDPPDADAHCQLDGADVFVEIAHLYGSEVDARLLFGRTGRGAVSAQQRRESSRLPAVKRLLGPLNHTLARKATKSYGAEPVWLVIRYGLPLWEREDFLAHRQQILVPEQHPFAEIWLLCGPPNHLELLRLT